MRVADEALKAAQVQLDNTIVRAPFAGVVTVKAAQPGEMISPVSAGGGSIRTGIGTVVDMDSLEIQVDVNESYINRVTPGQPVEATLNAYPDWKIPGEVIAIIPTADRSKATVKVRIAIKTKDARIVPDMGARVGFLDRKPAAGTPAPAPSVLVPADAVRTEGDASVVFVYNASGKVERRSVTLGPDASGQRSAQKRYRASAPQGGPGWRCAVLHAALDRPPAAGNFHPIGNLCPNYGTRSSAASAAGRCRFTSHGSACINKNSASTASSTSGQ